jgi:hypothetical protein
MAIFVDNHNHRAKRAVVSHVNSFEDFYVQKLATRSSLFDLNNRIEEYHRSDELRGAGDDQDLVLAKFSADGYLYRASVVCKQANKGKVFFVDYGNEEWVDDCFRIPADLAQLPHCATRCSLDIFEMPGKKEEARATFRKFFLNKEVSVEDFGMAGSNTWTVDLLVMVSPDGETLHDLEITS